MFLREQNFADSGDFTDAAQFSDDVINMSSNIFLASVPALQGAVEVTALLLPPRKKPS
jgi:hypothetical protein